MSNEEFNKLASPNIILVLLDINIPNTPTFYVTNNNENVTWNGNEYISFDFELEDISFSSKSEVTEWVVKFSNVNRVIEAYLQNYDLYLKQNGVQGNDITLDLRTVSSGDLGNLTPIQHYQSILNQPSSDAQWAVFKLTPKNTFNSTFQRKIHKNFCSWKFKGAECGYVGTAQVCDRTLTTCRAYNNAPRFGAFAGVGARGIKLVR